MFHSWMNRHWRAVAIWTAVTVALFTHPRTRPIVLWILPLGRSIDDIVVVGGLAFLGCILLFKALQPPQPKDE